jgi:hypothetical protein
VVERRQASAPAAEGRRKPIFSWRAAVPAGTAFMKHCVCRRSASFSFFFSFVIAGLDPAIHAAKRLEQNLDRLTSLHISMDHRVKPGGDEEKGCLTIWAGNSRADAPRER